MHDFTKKGILQKCRILLLFASSGCKCEQNDVDLQEFLSIAAREAENAVELQQSPCTLHDRRPQPQGLRPRKQRRLLDSIMPLDTMTLPECDDTSRIQ
ncbi:hypothetical protein ABD76_23105 [Paenibacillus dendritiformis]|nr:hypothetical protein [Paenibacillus dendritiformis]